jgi:hypothetical protein
MMLWTGRLAKVKQYTANPACVRVAFQATGLGLEPYPKPKIKQEAGSGGSRL